MRDILPSLLPPEIEVQMTIHTIKGRRNARYLGRIKRKIGGRLK